MHSSTLGTCSVPPLLRDNRQRTFRFRFGLAFGCPLSAFSKWE